ERDVLPEALAPRSASPIPALSENETLETIALVDPGAATDSSLTESSRHGRGNSTGGGGGAAVAMQISRRRAMPWRAAASCFHELSAISTGASARPIMIEEAIMTPPEALSATTSQAPIPNRPDCSA